APADNPALAVRSGESSAHEVDHLWGRKAMRPQDRLGAAVAGREQLERAAAVGLGAATRAAKWGMSSGVGGDLVVRIPCVRRPFEAARSCPRPRDQKAR